MVKLEQGRQLDNARLTPCGPKVEQNDLSAIAGEVYGACAVRDREVGGYFACLCGMRAAIARREQGERQEEEQGEATRKPHILIIRSERPGRKR